MNYIILETMTGPKEIKIGKEIIIPESELNFQFSTSGGPGGQHANRSSTRVTLLFDITNSPSLEEHHRSRLLEKLAHRLTKEGVLHINVQETRSQKKNRKIAVSRLAEVLESALEQPRRRKKTKPSQPSVEKRLAKKKKLSRRKHERRADWSEE